MKKINILLALIMFVTFFAGCTAHLRHHGAGVNVRVYPRWETRYQCHWVRYSHYHRVKRCRKVFTRVY